MYKNFMSLETTYTCYKLNIYTSAKYVQSNYACTYRQCSYDHNTMHGGVGNMWALFVKKEAKCTLVVCKRAISFVWIHANIFLLMK